MLNLWMKRNQIIKGLNKIEYIPVTKIEHKYIVFLKSKIINNIFMTNDKKIILL
jgi:hypothetical protein